jgi:serine/threonine protein phosphatase PrpC
VASDGVWDYVQKDVVVRASFRSNPHLEILEETLKQIGELHKKSMEEVKLISGEEKRAFHDDISIAVVQLGENSKGKRME